MSSGKGSGGYDAGPMLEYADKALALQQEMYNQAYGDAQPWYQAGTGAVNRLSDLMGLPGGSMQTRQDIYDQLAPQYTTQHQTPPSTSNIFVDHQGRAYDFDNVPSPLNRQAMRTGGTGWGDDVLSAYNAYQQERQNPQTTNIIDYDGLNAAIDAHYAAQQAPDDFGALTQGFTMEDYHADPGYQFRLAEGQKALERQLAASGQNFTPAALKALNAYNSGQAAQEYASAYDRYNIDQNNLFNRLAAMSGMGQTALSTTANAGTNYANQASNIYGQLSNNITSLQNTRMSQPSMFQQLVNAGAKLGPLFL